MPDDPIGDPDNVDGEIEVDLEDDEHSGDPEGEDDNGEQTDEDDSGPDDGGEGGGEPAPPAQTRGQRQFAELRRTARETAAENARTTAELARLRGELAELRVPRQQQETPAQRAERMALLSPAEQAQVVVQESLAEHSRQQQVLTNQLLDQGDSAAFSVKASADPLLRKIQPEIEQRLQALRATGQNLPRDTIATWILGEKVRQQRDSKNGKKSPAREQRREAQRARPVQGRGDVQADRGRRRGGGDSFADIESRFGDVLI